MEARALRRALVCAVVFASAACAEARGASYRTPNFVVQAATPALAREIALSAEAWRQRLALEWLGRQLPNWPEPCKVVANVSPQLGAGGATTFIFDRGRVFGWDMTVQGSRERVLDSVLPHEVTHTIFASHFRQPLPRWADEGACTTVEHVSEVSKQERLLIQFLKTGKGIPFSAMFAMKEYPAEVLPLYAQGHSLTQFLVERRGRSAFLAFLSEGMATENWPQAVARHYGHTTLLELQESWLDWVRQGRPRIPGEQAAAGIAAAAPVSPITPAATGAGPAPVRVASLEQPTPSPLGEPSVYASGLHAPVAEAVLAQPRRSVYEAGVPGRMLR